MGDSKAQSQSSPTTHTTEWLYTILDKLVGEPTNELVVRQRKQIPQAQAAILENLNRLIEQALQDYEYTGDIKGDCTCGHAKHFRGTWDSCDSCSCQNFTPLKATKKGV